MESEWQHETDVHRIFVEARSQRNAYFEKLAILDGGTVALVITAVLGPLHGVIRHKYLLASGLSVLVFAMLLLLLRNYLAAEFELFAAATTATREAAFSNPVKWYINRKGIRQIEAAGLTLSSIGIVLLLMEVWLILL
jgi:hypothetical protein